MDELNKLRYSTTITSLQQVNWQLVQQTRHYRVTVGTDRDPAKLKLTSRSYRFARSLGSDLLGPAVHIVLTNACQSELIVIR